MNACCVYRVLIEFSISPRLKLPDVPRGCLQQFPLPVEWNAPVPALFVSGLVWWDQDPHRPARRDAAGGHVFRNSRDDAPRLAQLLQVCYYGLVPVSGLLREPPDGRGPEALQRGNDLVGNFLFTYVHF